MKIQRSTLWLISLTLCLMLIFLALPVGAQETSQQTNQTTAAGSAPSAPPRILELTLGELIGILTGAGALAFAIGKALWDGNQPDLDQAISTEVDAAHSDREWIEKLERAYALNGLQAKTTIDALAGVLSNIAPLTGFKADDALLALLRDIQKPGAPDQEASLTYPTGSQVGESTAKKMTETIPRENRD